MMERIAETSPRLKARITGAFYLLAMLTGIFAQGFVSGSLVVDGDACTFVFYIFPDFSKVVNLWLFDSPMAIFELALSFWLLFKGLRSSGVAVPTKQAI